jgi:hypothetical protein
LFVLLSTFFTRMQGVDSENNRVSFGLPALYRVFAEQLIIKPYIRATFLDTFFCWFKDFSVYVIV